MRMSTWAGVSLALLGALTGCATTPDARFYTLGEPASPVAAADSTLSLALGPIDLPRYLDRPQMVTRDDGNRLAVDEYNRWGGSLEEEIQRVLSAHLGSRLGTARVYTYPSRIVAVTDYRIALDVRRFDGTLGGQVALDAAWSLIDDRSGEVVEVGRGRYEAPVTAPGHAGYAGALGGLLGQLGRDLAAAVAQRHAARSH